MDTQGFKLSIEERPVYLYVQASGERSKDTVQTIAMEVVKTAQSKNLTKVLIDVRELIGMFGVTDIYFLVTEVLEGLRGKGIDQVAIIDIRRSARPGWFLEPVAQNRGFNFRVFAEEKSALMWLGA